MLAPTRRSIERACQIRRSCGAPFPRRYNVLPTTLVPIIRRAADANELEHAEVVGILSVLPEQHPARVAYAAGARRG